MCTLHAWSLHACNDSQKKTKRTGNKSSRHDSPDDSMKLPTCQLVPASPPERRWILSANFRKLRGGWGALELLSVVQPSQAREARKRPRPRRSPPEATCTHFQANICGVGNWKKATEWRRAVDSAGSRVKKKKKKKACRHAVARPLAPAPLPCDGGCAWECALPRIVWFSAAFFVCRDYGSPSGV